MNTEGDEKLIKIFDPKILNNVINDGVAKGISRETLSILSDPKGRVILADGIINGNYSIAPPRILLIEKQDSKEYRKVYANNQLDRLLLALINNVYSQIYEYKIHPCCLSYQKGIGVESIIKSIVREITCSNKHVTGYKADLSKYFDSVNIKTIEEELKSMNTNSPLDKILWDYYHDDRVIDEHGNEICKYKSLAQGCAFGSLLANTVLYDVDEALSELDILYYRYSDDLLMIGPEAEQAKALLEKKLVVKGLSLNPKKVHNIDVNTDFTFLGFKIRGSKISLSDDSVSRYKKKVRKIIKEVKKHKSGRAAQKSVIKKLNNYLYNDYLINEKKFGWMEYFATISNDIDQMRMLDEFTKDRLKAVFTGKNNHTTNMHKTSNAQLEEMGYRSMVHMFKLRNISRTVYEGEIRKL